MGTYVLPSVVLYRFPGAVVTLEPSFVDDTHVFKVSWEGRERGIPISDELLYQEQLPINFIELVATKLLENWDVPDYIPSISNREVIWELQDEVQEAITNWENYFNVVND